MNSRLRPIVAVSRFAPALGQFVRDEHRWTNPNAAFEEAYGFPVRDVGIFVRGVVDTESRPDYDVDYATVTVPPVSPGESRSATRADVDRFHALFGQE